METGTVKYLSAAWAGTLALSFGLGCWTVKAGQATKNETSTTNQATTQGTLSTAKDVSQDIITRTVTKYVVGKPATNSLVKDPAAGCQVASVTTTKETKTDDHHDSSRTNLATVSSTADVREQRTETAGSAARYSLGVGCQPLLCGSLGGYSLLVSARVVGPFRVFLTDSILHPLSPAVGLALDF